MSTIQGPAYRIDDRLASREAFYALACDPARSVVVEACAGAGKTWMLVSRILRALLEGVPARQILAITFTKKAAAEMRLRLMEWLGQMASSEMSDADRMQALIDRGMSRSQAREMAPALQGLYEQVLANGESVEIRTFHAWFSQLMRAAPLQLLEELGLPSQPALVEDLSELKPDIWRQFLDAILEDDALRSDFEVLVRQRGRASTQEWLLGVLDKRIEFELADEAGTLDASVPSAAQWKPVFASFKHPEQRLRSTAVSSLLLQVAQALGKDKKATPQKQGAALEQALARPEDLLALLGAETALLTKDGGIRKHLQAPGLEEAVEFLREIREAVTQQAAHEEHQRLARLTRVLLREYAALKRTRGLADMADLERCALALLRDVELSGWLQQRLDSRISQVLIDEFQDTNPLQWQALSTWLAGYAGAGGGSSGQRPPSLFVVGDPKQSIYRFRRAEPRVFEAAKDLVREVFDGAVLACDHTRRNAPGVLRSLNQVFEATQAEGQFDGFRPHTTEVGEDTASVVYAIDQVERAVKQSEADESPSWRDSLTTPRTEAQEARRLEEARRVAAAITKLVKEQGAEPGEIFVLSRRRAQLRLLAEALREHHIPFATPEESVLMDALEVRDVIALMDALVSPTNNLALAQALRSPIFGASDDDLVSIALYARGGDTWWAALQTIPPAELTPALARARKLLTDWAGLATWLPPHDLIDRIISEGDLRARFAAAVPPQMRLAALSHLDALLSLSLQLDGGRYSTPYRFVRALRKRDLTMPARAEPDAVQLLTIHGAKGLEAKVVFVMDADTEARSSSTDRNDGNTVLIDWPAEDPHPRCFAFVASEGDVPPSLRITMEKERAARGREELNGLYVAMSRAREMLYFSSTEPHRRGSEATWWQRVTQPEDTVVVPIGLADLAISKAPPAATRPGTAVGAATAVISEIPLVEREVVAPRAGAGETGNPMTARVGEAVHRSLEWLTGQPDLDVDAILSATASAHQLDANGRAHASSAVRAILNSSAFQPFMVGAGVRWAGNEVEIAHRGQLHRIDRLVLREDGSEPEWWVLDYKIEHTPQDIPEYREQLAGYRAAVQDTEPGTKVRAAFVTGQGEVVELG